MGSQHIHSHSHSHHHGHHHHHHGDASGRMGWAFLLNLGFAILEFIGGMWANSLAITSDAIHDLGDAGAIGLAWALEKKSKKKSDPNFSYGYRRFSVMAALITGVILFLGSCLIIARAVPRLFQPEAPHIPGMMGLAILGLAVNGFAAFRMSRGTSLSERMILLHLLEDVLGWAVILVGAIVMNFVEMPILDPIMAIGVALWVWWNAFNNLKETMKVFLQATPSGVAVQEVQKTIRDFSLVQDVHHTHLWTMDGLHHILTAHIIVQEKSTQAEVHELKTNLKKKLFELYHIQEATIEVEWPSDKCYDPAH